MTAESECGQTKVDTTTELIPLHTLYQEEALPRRYFSICLPKASIGIAQHDKFCKGKTSIFATIYAQFSEAFQILNRLIAGMRHLFLQIICRLSNFVSCLPEIFIFSVYVDKKSVFSIMIKS